MDTLYYSNYCKHSQRVLHFVVKGNLTEKINFLCIDKREKDVNNNQIYIVLENGKESNYATKYSKCSRTSFSQTWI